MTSESVVLESVADLLPLSEARDANRCGRKAAALSDLARAGFEVPDGFVIPVGARATEREIAAALGRLGDGPVAVRSSGVAEDLEDQSHAGRYLSVLDVVGAAAVAAAAERCRASADGAPMAVLVQAMVRADAAGIAFSADPLTGDRGVARVSATRGLGDRLAAGTADGEEWSVAGDQAVRVAGEPVVLDGDAALGVARLARRVEVTRGAPQDIEWAIQGGRLLLLQARPITVLPVRPEIDIPTGTWQKDTSHFPEPVTPFAASTHLADAGWVKGMLEEWGLMPDDFRVRVIGHEFYVHVEPDDGGAKPPPWWVLAVVARLLPSLRRKLARARRVIDEGLLESLPAPWEAELKPRLQARLRELTALDPATLDDPALLAHVEELCRFVGENMLLHFRLDVPHVVGLHELAQACRELLGWDTSRAMHLLQGLSVASSAPTRELADIARFAAGRPAARTVLEARAPDTLGRLAQEDPEVAARVRDYLDVWGLRTFGSDAGRPSIAEQPDLVTGMIADLLAGSDRLAVSRGRDALVAEARRALEDPHARARFDAALAYAEKVYPLREDNVILTEQMGVGLLRRAGLEIGRRLAERDHLGAAADAFMLTRDELALALRGDDRAGLRERASRRRSEMAWVRAHPGPALYGPPPGPVPDLRGLPSPARRLNGALLWQLEQEWATATSQGDTLTGVAASAGVHRGRVRIARSVADLARLRAGEVLVCPATNAAWMMVFARAGALVADHGSVLSHTAIVAREHGLPAVVATGHATARLRDGEEVIVDGNRGTVTRCREG